MHNRIVLCLLPTIFAVSMHAAESATNATAWPALTSVNKPWTYWWWMGSAVNPADITRELERFHAAGIGGVHIIPIYGAKGYEAQYIDYLSPKWMEMLKHTVSEAKRLDMGVDMSTGTGWCFGGPTVSDADACANLASQIFDLKPGEHFKHKFAEKVQALRAVWPSGTQYDLAKDDLKPDGSIDWVVPNGDQPSKVYAIWQAAGKRTRVKRSAPGGGGHMINPFSADAITHYLQWFDKPFTDYIAQNGPMPRSMYHDSYEYQANWSPDLLAEFFKRRAYHLEDHLPDFLSEADNDTTARIKCDYRKTISDMMVDGLAKHWVDWSHAHGMITRYQAHGSPANLLDLYGMADIPETEMFHNDADPLVAKFASSAAHVMGHPLTSSETGTWMDEHFNETLAEYKKLVDLMFVSGVNHVFYHGACYSPEDAGWPGWHFYAATEMNSRNAFWHDVPAFNAYVARCQSILQNGKPDNDVLLYWPIHDLWSKSKGMTEGLVVHKTGWLHDEAVGKVAKSLWEGGQTFDYLSDRQLQDVRWTEGGFVTSGGARFRAIAIPRLARIPSASLEKLVELARAGGQIFTQGPLFPTQAPQQITAPGISGQFASTASMMGALESKLHVIPIPAPAGTTPSVLHTTNGGQIFTGLGDELSAIWCPGNLYEKMSDIPGIQFIRRFDDTGRTYFIVNHGDKPISCSVGLNGEAKDVLLMDAITGRTGKVPFEDRFPRTEFFLQLERSQSIVVKMLNAKLESVPQWRYAIGSGNPISFSGPWSVTFTSGGPVLPQPFKLDKLDSWTNHGDVETKRFAGTGAYTTTFDAPAGAKGPWRLDLGKVCESARVKLNGIELGTVFAPPFAVTVDALKPTGNELTIEVTNLSANRIRDLDKRGVKWKTFNDANVVNIDYKPFDASNWPIRDSGLLGPVTLTPISTEAPKKE